MQDEVAYRTLSALILAAFTVLALFGALLTWGRIAVYRASGYPRPRLLTRDAIVIGGLAIPFVLASIARAVGYMPNGELLWVLATGLPALFGIATYVYYELFVIDRDR